jgi:diaminopimelate epimerase
VSRIHVVKGQAYGNDFLLVRETDVTDHDPSQLARAICRPHVGLGADGLMLFDGDDDRGHVRMRLFNADGSQSEVSGNGVRCLAALLVVRHPHLRQVKIDTAAGPKLLELAARQEDELIFRAFMGMPEHIEVVDLDAAGERVRAVTLSVGNPQCVLLNDPLDEARFARLGPALEHHSAFPNRSNVSFVKIESPSRIRILIWERGVGPTTSSGTGSCGAAVAAAAHGGAGRDVEVISPGGSQRVEWRDQGLYLTGSASLVFEGEYVAAFP